MPARGFGAQALNIDSYIRINKDWTTSSLSGGDLNKAASSIGDDVDKMVGDKGVDDGKGGGENSGAQGNGAGNGGAGKKGFAATGGKKRKRGAAEGKGKRRKAADRVKAGPRPGLRGQNVDGKEKYQERSEINKEFTGGAQFDEARWREANERRQKDVDAHNGASHNEYNEMRETEEALNKRHRIHGVVNERRVNEHERMEAGISERMRYGETHMNSQDTASAVVNAGVGGVDVGDYTHRANQDMEIRRKHDGSGAYGHYGEADNGSGRMGDMRDANGLGKRFHYGQSDESGHEVIDGRGGFGHRNMATDHTRSREMRLETGHVEQREMFGSTGGSGGGASSNFSDPRSGALDFRYNTTESMELEHARNLSNRHGGRLDVVPGSGNGSSERSSGGVGQPPQHQHHQQQQQQQQQQRQQDDYSDMHHSRERMLAMMAPLPTTSSSSLSSDRLRFNYDDGMESHLSPVVGGRGPGLTGSTSAIGTLQQVRPGLEEGRASSNRHSTLQATGHQIQGDSQVYSHADYPDQQPRGVGIGNELLRYREGLIEREASGGVGGEPDLNFSRDALSLKYREEVEREMMLMATGAGSSIGSTGTSSIPGINSSSSGSGHLDSFNSEQIRAMLRYADTVGSGSAVGSVHSSHAITSGNQGQGSSLSPDASLYHHHHPHHLPHHPPPAPHHHPLPHLHYRYDPGYDEQEVALDGRARQAMSERMMSQYAVTTGAGGVRGVGEGVGGPVEWMDGRMLGGNQASSGLMDNPAATAMMMSNMMRYGMDAIDGRMGGQGSRRSGGYGSNSGGTSRDLI